MLSYDEVKEWSFKVISNRFGYFKTIVKLQYKGFIKSFIAGIVGNQEICGRNRCKALQWRSHVERTCDNAPIEFSNSRAAQLAINSWNVKAKDVIDEAMNGRKNKWLEMP